MKKYKIKYYYFAQGMSKADEFPEKIIEANSKDEAIFEYYNSNSYNITSFKEFMEKEKYVREWGITCKEI